MLEALGARDVCAFRCLFLLALHCSPSLSRVSYLVGRKSDLDEALAALMSIKELKQLELIVRNFVLTADELRVIGKSPPPQHSQARTLTNPCAGRVGMLPVADLRLDSYVYKQQPTLSRSSYSHVDNEGVKALVDGICTRWCSHNNAGKNNNNTGKQGGGGRSGRVGWGHTR